MSRLDLHARLVEARAVAMLALPNAAKKASTALRHWTRLAAGEFACLAPNHERARAFADGIEATAEAFGFGDEVAPFVVELRHAADELSPPVAEAAHG